MKVLIFDFDGTIADSFKELLGLFTDITGRQQNLSAQQIKELRGSPIRQIIKRLGIKPWQIPRLAFKAKRLLGPKIKDIKTFDGLPTIIKQLDEGDNLLLILSTNSPANIKAFLDANNLASYFDKIYGDISLLRKSAAIKKIVRHEKWPPGTVIYIGDEERDIEAARKAGVKSVAVGWGYNFPSVLEKAKPDALVNKPKDLLEALSSL